MFKEGGGENNKQQGGGGENNKQQDQLHLISNSHLYHWQRNSHIMLLTFNIAVALSRYNVLIYKITGVTEVTEVTEAKVQRKMKIHSWSTHHYADGGVGEVFESTKRFWSFRDKQCCSQIQ